MAPTRKATRNAAGRELTAEQVSVKYEEIRHSSRRIPRHQTLKLVRKYYSQGEILVESTKKVSLICPISKRRIVDACRGEQCLHLECFDLRSYLQFHTQLTFWECPVCDKDVSLERLRIDEYFTSVLQAVPAACTAVEILEDGSFNSIVANGLTDFVDITDEGPFVPQDTTLGQVKDEQMDDETTEAVTVPDLPDSVGPTTADDNLVFDEGCLHSGDTPSSGRCVELMRKKPGYVYNSITGSWCRRKGTATNFSGQGKQSKRRKEQWREYNRRRRDRIRQERQAQDALKHANG